jgi:hypothetical protein
MAASVLGLAFAGCAISLFLALQERGFIPVSTSFFHANHSTGPPPYRSDSLPEISER